MGHLVCQWCVGRQAGQFILSMTASPTGKTNYWLHHARCTLNNPSESGALASALFLGNALRCWMLEIAPDIPVGEPLKLPTLLASAPVQGNEWTQLKRLHETQDSWLHQLTQAYITSLSTRTDQEKAVLASSRTEWNCDDCAAWLHALSECIETGRTGLVHD